MSCIVPPPNVIAPGPIAEALASDSTPPEIVVVPEYVLMPESVVVPLPSCVRPPVPEMLLANERALERLKISRELFTTLPNPITPVVKLPICNAPAEIVVMPL